MPKKRLVISANCHGGVLKDLLLSSPSFAEKYDIDHVLNFCVVSNSIVVTDPKEKLFDTLYNCDVLIYQDIRQYDFPRLLSTLPMHTRKIRLPYYTTKIFWPTSSVKPINLARRGATALIPYPCFLLNNLIEEGNSIGSIVSRYIKINIPSLLPLNEEFTKQISYIRRVERGTLFRFTEYFLKSFKREKFFHLINHPSLSVFTYMANSILESLGEEPCSTVDADPFAGHQTPIHPSIIAHYDLQWCNEDTLYDILDIKVNFHEYVELYIDEYKKNTKKKVGTTMKSKPMCYKPWTDIALGSNGTYGPCCHALAFKTKYLPSSREKLLSLFNSKEYVQLRKDMLEGRPTGLFCDMCYFAKNPSTSSLQQVSLKNRPELQTPILNAILHGDIFVSHLPAYILFMTSFACNLSCTFCSQCSSDKNYWKNYDIKSFISLYNDTKFSEFDLIHIVGGEIFYSSDGKKIIDFLSSVDIGNTCVSVITNGMLIDKYFDKIKLIKNLSVMFSIEGYGKQYEKIRSYSDFNKIIKNIDKLKEVRKNKKTSFLLSSIIMKSTLDDVAKFLNEIAQRFEQIYLQKMIAGFVLENIFLYPSLLLETNWKSSFERSIDVARQNGLPQVASHLEQMRKELESAFTFPPEDIRRQERRRLYGLLTLAEIAPWQFYGRNPDAIPTKGAVARLAWNTVEWLALAGHRLSYELELLISRQIEILEEDKEALLPLYPGFRQALKAFSGRRLAVFGQETNYGAQAKHVLDPALDLHLAAVVEADDRLLGCTAFGVPVLPLEMLRHIRPDVVLLPEAFASWAYPAMCLLLEKGTPVVFSNGCVAHCDPEHVRLRAGLCNELCESGNHSVRTEIVASVFRSIGQALDALRGRSVLVWGTGGRYHELFAPYFRQPDCPIQLVGFVDNNPEMQGKTFEGKSVYAPEALVSAQPPRYDAVIIASFAYKAIYRDLCRLAPPWTPVLMGQGAVSVTHPDLQLSDSL